jgi:hypothetical protein
MATETIQDLIRKLSKSREENYSIAAVVLERDDNNRTCTVEPLNGDAKLFNVRLNASESNDAGLTIYPETGSNVIVTFINRQIAYVALADKIEKIELHCEDVVINNGTHGGLVISGKAAERLNAIENDLNNLKTMFALWSPASGDGGALLKTATENWYTEPLTQTTASEMENDKIKH